MQGIPGIDEAPAVVAFLQRLWQAAAPRNGRSPTRKVLKRRATDILKEARRREQLPAVVEGLVGATGIDGFLPARYARFQAPLTEGLIFYLLHQPLSVLADKVVDQLYLPTDATGGQRLYALVKDMAAIQKLGQVVCRAPGIDPTFKRALVDLEDNVGSLTYGRLRPALKKEITAVDRRFDIRVEPRILAEATVCAVVPAEVTDSGKSRRAVLKIVKPRVRANLPRELALLEKLAAYFDRRREDWGLGRFNFQSTLDRVRGLLENEVNLAQEQNNLEAAEAYYRGNSRLAIPVRLAASTASMTVMTRLDGTKITDVGHLDPDQRRRLAEALAKTCIVRPIQDLSEKSVFHGDPHAGNLAYRFEGDQPRVILYDWSMTGRLTRLERFALVVLTLGLIVANRMAVFYAADIVSGGQLTASGSMREKALAEVDRVIRDPDIRSAGPLAALERLLEGLSYRGVVFSADLMMFEKALITLKGVLTDVDPEFNRADFVLRSALATFIADMIRLRLLKLVLEEVWSLYRYSFFLMLDIQRVLLKFILDVGRLMHRPLYRSAGHLQID